MNPDHGHIFVPVFK